MDGVFQFSKTIIPAPKIVLFSLLSQTASAYCRELLALRKKNDFFNFLNIRMFFERPWHIWWKFFSRTFSLDWSRFKQSKINSSGAACHLLSSFSQCGWPCVRLYSYPELKKKLVITSWPCFHCCVKINWLFSTHLSKTVSKRGWSEFWG